ncbi:MAG: DoxX family protein [Actinobacteria bacterium]|nr:DoxX family protein [Actinomycetota bacterium]
MARVPRGLCAAFFLGAGVLHFVRPETYRPTVPPGFGDPSAVVLLSGIAEIAGGLALLSTDARRLARWWLVALLVAVFPANVYMVLEPDQAGVSAIPEWLLWVRLPLQPLLVWWVWRVTRPAARGPASPGGPKDPLTVQSST